MGRRHAQQHGRRWPWDAAKRVPRMPGRSWVGRRHATSPNGMQPVDLALEEASACDTRRRRLPARPRPTTFGAAAAAAGRRSASVPPVTKCVASVGCRGVAAQRAVAFMPNVRMRDPPFRSGGARQRAECNAAPCQGLALLIGGMDTWDRGPRGMVQWHNRLARGQTLLSFVWHALYQGH